MKRNILFSKPLFKICIQFLISASIGTAVLLALLAVVSFVHLKHHLGDMPIQIISIMISIVGVSVCTVMFTFFGKIKGYIAGLVSSATFCTIKVIYTLIKFGAGKINILTYIILICCSLICGIVAAGRKYKRKW